MDKYIYDESNGLWYELQGDYYIPCLTLPAEKENKPISLWGQRHKHYLQEHKRTVYQGSASGNGSPNRKSNQRRPDHLFRATLSSWG